MAKICARSLRHESCVLAAQAARLVAGGSKSVLVATNDQCIKDCLSGAFFVSSALLLKEVTKVPLPTDRPTQSLSCACAVTMSFMSCMLPACGLCCGCNGLSW